MLLPSLSLSPSPTPSPSFSPPFKPLKASSTPSPKPPPLSTSVIVIGAGLSGLAAATRLHAANIPFLLLDSSDAVGGRVRSDTVDSFILDRGFQILITAYPEAKSLLDYPSLRLHRFYSGARIFHGGAFHTVADPIRHPRDSISGLFNPIGGVVDKVLVALTRVRVLTKTDEAILREGEVRTVDLLRGIGFSEAMLERFFRPFFGGVFFDRELETTSRLFNFVFKCLALGDNALPGRGICAIPEQLAGRLPKDSILLKSRVVGIDVEGEGEGEGEEGNGFGVRLESGEVLRSEVGVIVAVEEFEAAKLLAGNGGNEIRVRKPVRSTVCLYFCADEDRIPVKDPVLFLNGSGKGIVNNMFFPTNVAPSYGPPGKGLVSVTLVGLFDDVEEGELVEQVVKELSGWFGEGVVREWRYMRMYKIGFAQPNQCPPTDLMKDPRVKPGLYICGDYVTNATFDGALVSGRRAVEALIKERVQIEA